MTVSENVCVTISETVKSVLPLFSTILSVSEESDSNLSPVVKEPTTFVSVTVDDVAPNTNPVAPEVTPTTEHHH